MVKENGMLENPSLATSCELLLCIKTESHVKRRKKRSLVTSEEEENVLGSSLTQFRPDEYYDQTCFEEVSKDLKGPEIP